MGVFAKGAKDLPKATAKEAATAVVKEVARAGTEAAKVAAKRKWG